MAQRHNKSWEILQAWFGRKKILLAPDWDRRAAPQTHESAIDSQLAQEVQLPSFVETMHTKFGGDTELVRMDVAMKQLLDSPRHSEKFSEILKARSKPANVSPAYAALCRSSTLILHTGFQVAKIMLVQPLTSVACERGFSCMARLKTAIRNRMSTKHLRLFMRIVGMKVPIEEFDFALAVRHFMAQKHRRGKM